MTPKERVLAVIEHRNVDRIPVCNIQFSGHAASVILGREALVGGAFLQWKEMRALWDGPRAHAEFDARCEEDAVAVAEACGHDVLRLTYWRWGQKPARMIDDYTFVFHEDDGSEYCMTYLPEIEQFTLRRDDNTAFVRETGRLAPGQVDEDFLRDLVYRSEEAAEVFVPADDFADRMRDCNRRYEDYLVRWECGGANLRADAAGDLAAAALWPELMARLLMAEARIVAKKIEALAEAGMRVNFGGCDFCSQKGPMYSPDTFRRVVMPGLKIITDACHAHGVYYFFSTDGNLWPVAEALFDEAGVDGYYEVDRGAGMDLRALRERFPRVILMGNISSQTLHLGTREAVVREVEECMRVAHDLGGVIAGVSNMIMPGTPPENIFALVDKLAALR